MSLRILIQFLGNKSYIETIFFRLIISLFAVWLWPTQILCQMTFDTLKIQLQSTLVEIIFYWIPILYCICILETVWFKSILCLCIVDFLLLYFDLDWLTRWSRSTIIENHIGWNTEHFIDCYFFYDAVWGVVPSEISSKKQNF